MFSMKYKMMPVKAESYIMIRNVYKLPYDPLEDPLIPADPLHVVDLSVQASIFFQMVRR